MGANTMGKKKLRVMVLYGGRSGEHEISLRSAASVIRHLDPARYEVVPVCIDKQGQWLLNDVSLIDKSAESLAVLKGAPRIVLPPHPGSVETGLVTLSSEEPVNSKTQGLVAPRHGSGPCPGSGTDVVFPVMHGPLCEDGTIQGLLELADIPYVGSGVLASSVGMDKDVAKRLARDAGLPIVPYVAIKNGSWKKDFDTFSQAAFKKLGLPLFVKPANLGSSVGVHKVKEIGKLRPALEDAFRYDTKVLIEKAVNAREIEFAVLENSDPTGAPLVSQPGEIVPRHEFYSYEAKYLDEAGAELLIPARLDPSQIAKGQRIAQDAFTVLECEGMARVDFFVDRNTGDFYFNEVNTIPGFTSISMYPKMWEASGIPYAELLSRLIDLAVLRHNRKRNLTRNYSEASTDAE
jgi:D-alanine-D-alanine ligase